MHSHMLLPFGGYLFEEQCFNQKKSIQIASANFSMALLLCTLCIWISEGHFTFQKQHASQSVLKTASYFKGASHL